MRIILRLTLAAALVTAGVGPAAAQYAPGGTYQQSCVNVRVYGGTLQASCTAPSGQYITSSINIGACGGGDIANNNGYLRCGGGGGGGYAPSGSYQQSCVNIRVYGNELSGSCTAPNGQRIQSTTNLGCNGDIVNRNGYLACNGAGGGGYYPNPGYPSYPGYNGRPPSGSYQASCQRVYLRDGILSATCTAANGQLITSSLAVHRCRPDSDIANIDGRLDCLQYR
jgi:hypothetical protein